jgi:hypothetical protein
MGCSCPSCNHKYVTDCEGAYCECCSITNHVVDSLIKDESEISEMLETKYNFASLVESYTVKEDTVERKIRRKANLLVKSENKKNKNKK